MITFAVTQCGLAVAAAPGLSRWPANSTLRRALATTDRHMMGLYLWHMVPVIVVSLIAYPTGMLPEPAAGSATWWWWRPVWVAVLSAVTAAELALIAWRGKIFTRALPTVAVRLRASWSAPMLLAAFVLVVVPLWHFAADGFAADGKFPTLMALLYVLGASLVIVVPQEPAKATEPHQRGRRVQPAVGLPAAQPPFSPVIRVLHEFKLDRVFRGQMPPIDLDRRPSRPT